LRFFFFFKFVISARDYHCYGLAQGPENLAMPLSLRPACFIDEAFFW